MDILFSLSSSVGHLPVSGVISTCQVIEKYQKKCNFSALKYYQFIGLEINTLGLF